MRLARLQQHALQKTGCSTARVWRMLQLAWSGLDATAAPNPLTAVDCRTTQLIAGPPAHLVVLVHQ